MQRITALWNRGLIGKLTISLIGLVVVCCILGVIFRPSGQRQTGQPTAAADAAVQPTADQPTAQPAATAAPEATAGPTEPPAPTATPEPTDTPEPTEAPTATPEPTPPPEPIVIEGSGQIVTDPFTPLAGVYRVSFTHDGRRNFIVQAYAGDDTDFLVNTIGAYEGSRPLIGGNELFFEVNADGAWTIRVEPIAFDEAVAGGTQGTGDQVTGLFTPTKQGATPYAFTHTGERNFIVQLHCAGGSDVVQNVIGAADNEAVVRFRDAPCFWEVQADGDWSIRPK